MIKNNCCIRHFNNVLFLILSILSIQSFHVKADSGLTKTESPVPFGKLTYVTGYGFSLSSDLRCIFIENDDVGFPVKNPDYKNYLSRNGEKVTILQRYENVLTIELPVADYGMALLLLDESRQMNKSLIINKPDLQWLSTDEGWPGDTIRALGKGLVNLSLYPDKDSMGLPVSYSNYISGKARVCILDSKNIFHKAEVIKMSAYDIHFILPGSLAPGKVKVYVHAGTGGKLGWSEPQIMHISKPQEWPDKVFNILDYGAEGNGIADDTKAVTQALGDIKKNGGGVLFFPAGGYHLNKTFRLPDKTIIKGESRERSWIFLPDGFRTNALDSSVNVVFAGEGSVGMENISIHSVYAGMILVAPVGDTLPKNWIDFAWNNNDTNAHANYSYVKNCRILDNRTHLYHRRKDDPRIGLFQRKNHVNVLLKGKYIEISHSEFQARESNVYLCDSKYSRIADNIMHSGNAANNIALQHGSSGYEKIIVENNEMDGIVPTNHGSVWMMHGGKNMFFYNNHVVRQFWVSDNEGLLGHMWGYRLPLFIKKTYDDRIEVDSQKWHAYWEKMNKETGRLAQYFPFNKQKTDQNDFSIYIGKEVQVFRGKGLGQVNKIADVKGNTIYFEKPFRTPLNTESFLVVHDAPAFRHITFAKNTVEDAGPAVFLWGHSHEIVIDGNRATRTGPIGAWTVYHAFSVAGGCHFFQIINNYCNEGRCLNVGQHEPGGRYEAGGIGAHYSCESDWASGGGALNYVGYIIRNNYLENDCSFNYPGYDVTWCDQAVKASEERKINPFDFIGMTFESNVNMNCKYGMIFGSSIQAVLKNNKFENVEIPVFGKENEHILMLNNK